MNIIEEYVCGRVKDIMSKLIHQYIVAYDIKNDSRRLHIARVLQSYGNRLQYSVFLMEMREVRLMKMMDKLRTLVNSAEDSLIVARLNDGLTSEAIIFVGSRSYEDVSVPTVI